MLRKIRIALAAVFYTVLTLMFLGFSGVLAGWFGWMAKIQFIPALLAVHVGTVVLLLVLTLIFGRIYCSVICPMGVYQDIVSHLSGRRKKHRLRFRPSKPLTWLRITMLVVFIASLLIGIPAVTAILAPYSSYGRIVQTVLNPAVWGSLPVVAASVALLVLITALAWKNGRIWCNTACPVGTVLGFFSRFSLFRPVIDTNKCKNCGMCGKKCKSSCIDTAAHSIDYSRCVTCFDCLENCSFSAISYRFIGAAQKKETPVQENKDTTGRRAFIASSVIAATAATLGAQEKKRDGGLADVIAKKQPERETPLTPFGSLSVKNFSQHCTACQLCVSACPNNVLRPSTSFERFMQPEMSFERGFCRPECVKCSEVCPAGAILPITREEKTAIHVGLASVDRSMCIVEKEGISCGNCARHCPVGAIRLVRKDPDDPNSLRIPSVDESRCIGCGACEFLCPVRPVSAIRVNGRDVHIKE